MGLGMNVRMIGHAHEPRLAGEFEEHRAGAIFMNVARAQVTNDQRPAAPDLPRHVPRLKKVREVVHPLQLSIFWQPG
jgi:hypothetical protein